VPTYLEQAQKRAEEYRAANAAVIKKAEDESRGLTADELTSVTETGVKLDGELRAIKFNVDEAVRAKAVADLAVSTTDSNGGELDEGGSSAAGEGGEGGAVRSASSTSPRDPGHYRAAKERGPGHSWYTDHFRAHHMGDTNAIKRLTEYDTFSGVRAVTQASGGVGTVQPKWLIEEFAALARAQRVVANLVRQVPLGDDPRALNMGRQTVGVDANITNQTTEGVNNGGWGADRFTTADDTLTPVARAVWQDISRQFLVAGNPATDTLVTEDIAAAWNAAVESYVCATIAAGATDSGVIFANEAAFSSIASGVSAALNGVITAQGAVAADKRGQADITVMNARRFTDFRKLRDTTGRALMPVERYAPQNASGAMGNSLVGDAEGTSAYLSFGFDNTTYPEKYYTARGQAIYLAESNKYDFQYDQIVGPAAVRMGTFGYVGAMVRFAAEVQFMTVTAAT
jgi:HK97 family phage major capsid protein